MNDLFKLTFTPIVNGYESINKYKVRVEYFNKHVIGARFDLRNDKGLGDIIFFIKDFIDVTSYYLEGYGGETFTSESVPNKDYLIEDYVIEERYIKSYVDSIEKVKPQLEKYCLEKQKSEDCREKAYENWQQKKPIEYSF